MQKHPRTMSNAELAASLQPLKDVFAEAGMMSGEALTEAIARLEMLDLLPVPLLDVINEVERATALFPSWPKDPFHALAIITEELGELSQTFLKRTYEGQWSADRTEAVQLARWPCGSSTIGKTIHSRSSAPQGTRFDAAGRGSIAADAVSTRRERGD